MSDDARFRYHETQRHRVEEVIRLHGWGSHELRAINGEIDREWRDQVLIDGVVPEDGASTVDLLRDVSARMRRYGVSPMFLSGEIDAQRADNKGRAVELAKLAGRAVELAKLADRNSNYLKGDVGNDVAGWSVVWGAETQFWGVDLGQEPSIGVVGKWHGEKLEIVAVDPPGAPLVTRSEMPAACGIFTKLQLKPKPRREPFPNPEAAAWRPKV